MYVLPTSILGTGLALRAKGKHISITHKNEAAKLIVTIWKFYKLNNSDINKKFILLLKFLLTRQRFNATSNRNGNHLHQYSNTQMLKRIEVIENDLHYCQLELKLQAIRLNAMVESLNQINAGLDNIQHILQIN